MMSELFFDIKGPDHINEVDENRYAKDSRKEALIELNCMSKSL